MAKFLTELDVKCINDGSWRLSSPLEYESDIVGLIQVPLNFETDFASVPRVPIAYTLFGNRAHRESVLHDYLYQMKRILHRLELISLAKPVTRKEADRIWLNAMLLDFGHHKTGRLVAITEYVAVRLFGFMAWREKNGGKEPRK